MWYEYLRRYLSFVGVFARIQRPLPRRAVFRIERSDGAHSLSGFAGHSGAKPDHSGPTPVKLRLINREIYELEATAAKWQTGANPQQQVAQEGGVAGAADIIGLGRSKVCRSNIVSSGCRFRVWGIWVEETIRASRTRWLRAPGMARSRIRNAPMTAPTYGILNLNPINAFVLSSRNSCQPKRRTFRKTFMLIDNRLAMKPKRVRRSWPRSLL